MTSLARHSSSCAAYNIPIVSVDDQSRWLADAMSYPPRAAARTKLKKLIKDAEEKARKDVADASNKGPTERSPHAKEVRIADFACPFKVGNAGCAKAPAPHLL